MLEDGTQKEEAKEEQEETGLTTLSPGCTIEGESFMDGMQVGPIEVIHTVWFIMDFRYILISSHFVHTDRHTDKWTHYNVPEF